MDFGNIKNPERARQLNIFKGLSSDGVDATDIDGLIEYRNRAYIVYEVKGVGAEVPVGQRLALERFVTDAAKSGKVAIVMVVEHTVTDITKPVIVKDCRVRDIYYGRERRWRKPKKPMTAGQLTDTFLRGIESGLIK